MEGESGAADAKEETAKRHTYALIRVSTFFISKNSGFEKYLFK
jgi:hypothetical protein